MSHTIVGKLNNAANEFQTQNGSGFGVRLGVQYYDHETKTKQWTNYDAVIFASQPSQIDFYRSALVAGAVIELSGESQKIKQFQGQNGLMLSIELLNARLGYVYNTQGQQPAAPQQGYAAPAAHQYAAPAAPQYQSPPPSQQPQYQVQGGHPSNFPQPR